MSEILCILRPDSVKEMGVPEWPHYVIGYSKFRHLVVRRELVEQEWYDPVWIYTAACGQTSQKHYGPATLRRKPCPKCYAKD